MTRTSAPVRGGPAPPGHRAPAGPGAVPADPAQRRRAAVRRRAVGQAGPGGARRVRRGAARHGRRVHYFGQLLARRWSCRGRAFVLDRSARRSGRPGLVGPLRRLFDDSTARPWPSSWSAGSSRRTCTRRGRQPAVGHAAGRRLRAHAAAQPPVPARQLRWVYGGVSVNPMAKPARQRETLHSRAIYRYPPDVRRSRLRHATTATTTPTTAGHRRRRRRARARQRRGDDRHGRADHPEGIEMLASALFAGGQASRVIAVELPPRGRSCTWTRS